MNGWLADTNFVSELSKPKPNRRVAALAATLPIEQIYISTVSLAEIRFGIGLAQGSLRGQELDQWLSSEIRPMFANRVLEITEEVLLTWRVLVDQGRKVNRTFSQPDLFLAATAIEHDLILLTRNIRDFIGLPIQLINP